MKGFFAHFYTVGAVLMVTLGTFKALTGIIGLFNHQWVLQGFKGYFFVNATAIAVWWLVIGLIALFGGLAVMQSKTWGRIVGVIVCGLSIISHFFLLPITPTWSVLMIALHTIILISFIVVERPAAGAPEERA